MIEVGMDDRTKRFWEFVSICKEVWGKSARSNLMFWIGVWYGEEGRSRLKDSDSDNVIWAFEFGIQIRPILQEIDKNVRIALIQAAVAMLLEAFGIKKKQGG